MKAYIPLQGKAELVRVAGLSAFNVAGYTKRIKVNQYVTKYTFPDDSILLINHYRGVGTCGDVTRDLLINSRGA